MRTYSSHTLVQTSRASSSSAVSFFLEAAGLLEFWAPTPDPLAPRCPDLGRSGFDLLNDHRQNLHPPPPLDTPHLSPVSWSSLPSWALAIEPLSLPRKSRRIVLLFSTMAPAALCEGVRPGNLSSFRCGPPSTVFALFSGRASLFVV